MSDTTAQNGQEVAAEAPKAAAVETSKAAAVETSKPEAVDAAKTEASNGDSSAPRRVITIAAQCSTFILNKNDRSNHLFFSYYFVVFFVLLSSFLTKSRSWPIKIVNYFLIGLFLFRRIIYSNFTQNFIKLDQ